uniref:Uncharacterized protein n=1 Tax=Caulobacter phage BL57 TaxID=3348355 RepID=A0AB74ULF9_9VIRU
MTAEILAAEQPRPITDETMDRVMRALDRLQANAVEAAIEKTQRSAERVKEAALDDQRRKLLLGAAENARRGVYTLSPLHADPYRDTSAVLAETRTRLFAARLAYSDPDGTWTVTFVLKLHADGHARRFEKEITTPTAAWDFYEKVCARFYQRAGFVCRVDY